MPGKPFTGKKSGQSTRRIKQVELDRRAAIQKEKETKKTLRMKGGSRKRQTPEERRARLESNMSKLSKALARKANKVFGGTGMIKKLRDLSKEDFSTRNGKVNFLETVSARSINEERFPAETELLRKMLINALFLEGKDAKLIRSATVNVIEKKEMVELLPWVKEIAKTEKKYLDNIQRMKDRFAARTAVCPKPIKTKIQSFITRLEKSGRMSAFGNQFIDNVKSLMDSSPERRGAAVMEIGRSRFSKVATDLSLLMLNDPGHNVEYHAVMAVGFAGGDLARRNKSEQNKRAKTANQKSIDAAIKALKERAKKGNPRETINMAKFGINRIKKG